MLNTLTKDVIIYESQKIKVSGKISKDLAASYQIATFLTPHLLTHFEKLETQGKLIWTREEYSKKIEDNLEAYYKDVLPRLTLIKDSPIAEKDKLSNIFNFAGCEQLAKSNNYSRTITTVLGQYLERVVDDCPRTFSTEKKYSGLKLKGVDTIIYKDGVLYFTQLKTKQDTLTGSQAPRSIIELSTYPNSMFAAQFSLGNWTFNPSDSGVMRISGAEFWNLIDTDYAVIQEIVSRKMQAFEKHLFDKK